ncbi:MBL fold metallo-hydrolase [Polyangium spumosum]|uniref:MBL fold metallo-hydrolase n=1 Tax=Polyangium spumosum TaxID=889282 RepID=A0A6N7PL37_9BACT|nr:MBL fold metallo-hydrolase [Polyangium spumosum]MRG90815.1 MBL fold metallo-hydrolase [Polyangium spumosum]
MSSSRLVTIDCDYLGPGVAAAYLRVEGDEAAFVETNTTHAVPRLLAALAREGLAPEAVRWVIVTHVHLDHAGGASALLAALPNATVLAHPRAARHLVDPSKLVKSAEAVYGAARFAELYGTIQPIDASRVRSLEDHAVVSLGSATLSFVHTRGHANHHFIVLDPAREAVFTGDTFGLVYPRLQRGRRLAFPSTSPTDFDAEAAHASIDVVLRSGARRAALTHFGEIEDLDVVASALHRWIDLSAALVDAAVALAPAEAEPMIRAALEKEMERAAGDAGISLDAEDLALLELDLALNAQGLAYVASKRRA